MKRRNYFFKIQLSILGFSLGFTLPVAADFQLLSESKTDHQHSFKLSYQAISERNVSLENIDISQLQDQNLTEQAELSQREFTLHESCLLALSCDPSGQAEIAITPEKYAKKVEVKPVQVGPQYCLQVIMDPAKLDGNNDAFEFTIYLKNVSNQPLCEKSEANSISKNHDKSFSNWDFVLNSESINKSKRVPFAPKWSKTGVITYPSRSVLGTHRVNYIEGDRLARIQVDSNWSTDTVQIVHGGNTLPVIQWEEHEALIYLPERRNRITDRFDSVFLSDQATSPSQIIAQREAFDQLIPQSQEVGINRSQRYDDNLMYERATPLPIGERFVQYRLSRNQTKTIELPFQDRLAESELKAEIQLLSITKNSSLNPDHFSELSFGTETPAILTSWEGIASHETSTTFTVNLSQNMGMPTNIQFVHKIPTIPGGPTSDLQNLNYIDLSWVGFPKVDSTNRLMLELDEATTPSNQLITIGGFPTETVADDLMVLEISGESPVQLTNFSTFTDESNKIAVEFEALPSDRRFLVELRSNAQTPEEFPVPVTPLPSVAELELLKGIYVCPPEYRSTLQPLLDLRGEGFIVLEPQAAYDHYFEGQESPEAIRLALANLIADAPNSVDFPAITLVGFASFDQRDYLGLIDFPVVPTFVEESIDTGFTIENCIDFPYGLLFGDDELIDAMVGRLPAKNTGELEIMVSRIIDHESSARALADQKRPGLFIYDNVEEILLDRALWESKWNDTQHPFQEVVRTPTNTAEAKAEIDSLIQAEPTSASMIFYMGHGNNSIWAGGQFMTSAQATTLDTKSGYPFVATFTCLNAYYAFPGATTRSLGESWLLAPQGKGAIASFAPSSVDLYTFQRQMALATMNQLASSRRPKTIGEVITRARIQMAIDNPNIPKTNREYILFGDPNSSTTIDQLFADGLWLVY